jgi:hypothetical protein
MKLFQFTIIFLFLLSGVGCSQSANQEVSSASQVDDTESEQQSNDIIEGLIKEKREPVDKMSGEICGDEKMTEYISEEFGFKLRFSSDWELRENVDKFSPGGISVGKEVVSVSILPTGGLGYGSPWHDPEISQVQYNHVRGLQKKWLLDNNSTLILFYPENPPLSWNDENRIDFHGSIESEKCFANLMDTFEFINE